MSEIDQILEIMGDMHVPEDPKCEFCKRDVQTMHDRAFILSVMICTTCEKRLKKDNALIETIKILLKI